MRKEKSKKIDKKFLIILAIIVGVTFVLSLFIGGTEKAPEIVVLPDEVKDTANKLIINEVVSNNGGVYANEHGDVCDYVELYNGTGKDKDLTGFGLSDVKTTIKWAFPEGTVIKAGEYMIVGLTGSNESGLNANFKLSSSGKETVILTNAAKKVIDACETVAMKRGQAMIRNVDGSWNVVEFGTPGFENSVKGQEAYFESIKSSNAPELVINEFLPRNNGNFISSYGTMDGYIEVKNVSNHSINLSEYTVSNSKENPFRFQLPDVTISAGEVYVVFTTKKDSTRTDTIGFEFETKAGSVALGHNGKVVHTVDYTGLANGMAMARLADGNLYEMATISPGYENDAEGIQKFQEKNMHMPNGLVINEVMGENNKYLAQNGNNYYDWVELYNNSKNEIKLSDYYLTTSATDLHRYQLPEVTLGAGEYFVIMCSGNTNLTNKSYYHADMKISAAEAVYLVSGSDIVDSLFVASVPKGYSYGRTEKGVGYFSTPTPVAKNGDATLFISSSPIVSQKGGVYDSVENITVSVQGGGSVYYTTNGSEPSKDSKKYSGPITVSATTVLKFRNYDEGGYHSPTVTESYIVNENHTLPVLSLSINPDHISYLNSNPGTQNEYPAYVEFFEGDNGFAQGCAINLFGGNARWQKQKSYALKFNKGYGTGPVQYPVFDKRDNSEYSQLVLRCGSTDQTASIIKDIYATSLVDDTGVVDVGAYKTIIVYINGKYWGIYNFREKLNDEFVENHYNVDKDTVNLFEIDGEVKSGSRKAWLQLVNYCKTHDMTKKESYEYVCSKLDIENFTDYWICEGYVTNHDLLNVRYFNSPELDDGKFKCIYYDFDYAWHNINVDWYNRYVCNPTGFYLYNFDNTIIRTLLTNKEYQKYWFERLAYNLRNTYDKQKMRDRLKEIQDTYAPELERHQKRWGRTMSQYNDGIKVLKNWIEKRQYYYLNNTKNYFHLSEAQMKEYFGELWG